MIAINRPPQPIFGLGQLVRHLRYGYRGVVVDRDEFCEADDDWYSKN
jgi:hemimethylated DNA binding protein